MAASALANGESKWITSEAARADVQHWRAQSGAVLTSAATVLADDPRLDVRIEAPRQPLRVVLDRRRALRKTARILAPPGDVLVFAAPTRERKAGPSDERLGDARVERIRVALPPRSAGSVRASGRARSERDVLVEAGSRLARRLCLPPAWSTNGLLLYIAPKLLGRRRNLWRTLPRLTKLATAPRFEIIGIAV